MTNIKECKAAVPANLDLQSGFGKQVVIKHFAADLPLPEDISKLDYEKHKQESQERLNAVEPQDNIQLLLAAQMTAIHGYQQRMMSYAVNATLVDSSVKYGNLVAKLSNVFIQQVNLMQKLKNGNQQKVVFEHVHVHSGGQAVVGTVNTHPRREKS